MKKYFIHNGSNESGPFDIDELKQKSLSKDTPVWFDGLANWTKAEEIPELASVFESSPPPFQGLRSEQSNHSNDSATTTTYTQTAYTSKKPRRKWYWTFLILLIAILAGKLIFDQIQRQNRIAERQDSINIEEDSKREIRNNIKSYVTAERSSYNFNSLGGISNLSIIVNNNTDYVIDKVQVKIFYYKPNGDVWNARTVDFNMLGAQTQNTIRIPDTERGVRVEYEIVSIKSHALDLD